MFSFFFSPFPAHSCLKTKPFTHTSISDSIPDEIAPTFFENESFTVGAGVSYYFDTDNSPVKRSIVGYFISFSVEKRVFDNLAFSAGFDGYNVPKSNTKMIGNINLNISYEIPLGDKIIIGLNSGLFTGFIQRRNSSGINSGAKLGTSIKYKINNKYQAGISIKYPFFTEVSGIYLVNTFFTF